MRPADEPRRAPPTPDSPALTTLRLACLVAALAALAWTTVDPDLWGHVRFGGDILSTQALDPSDPYSFTSDRPWINHEWLAEIAMYGAFTAGGPPGLVALKMIVVVGVLACLLVSFRRYDWQATDHDLLIVVALVGMLGRYHPVRPQLFSLLLFAAMLLALTAADRGRRVALMAVPVMFVLWANLHGGFLTGLAVLAVWCGVRMIQRPRQWSGIVAVGLSSVLATLLTPYGLDLWRFLWETVAPVRPGILDWQPVWRAGLLVLLPWLLVVGAAAAAVRRARGHVDPGSLAIVLLLGMASARVGRIDAFFAIAVVMLLGPAFALGPTTGRRTRLPRWALVAGAAIGAVGLVVFERRAACLEMLRYPEPDAITFLKDHPGRMLTFFDWGQYAIWHLAPALEVSIDGRRETVYSEELMDAHLRLYRDEPGATALVDRLQPDVIWLPASLSVNATLESMGWRPVFRGPVSIVLSRQAGTDPVLARASAGRRCFPDA